jgi:hypothetical protein
MSRGIKHSVYESLDKTIFDTNFIVDLDLRSSGLSTGKKSFMNLEINFFIIQTDMDFKSDEIKNSLKEIINQIFLDNFLENENFKFYLTKKIKSSEEPVQIENV